MGTIEAMAMIAAGASLAGGVFTTVLSRLRSDLDLTRTVQPRPTRKAELKATSKALGESLKISERGMRRLRILMFVATAYGAGSVALLTLPESGGGQSRAILGFLAFLAAGVLVGLLCAATLMAYRSVRDHQRSLEQQVEQVHRLARH